MSFVVLLGCEFLRISEREMFEYFGINVRPLDHHTFRMLVTNVASYGSVVLGEECEIPHSVTGVVRPGDLLRVDGVLIRYLPKRSVVRKMADETLATVAA